MDGACGAVRQPRPPSAAEPGDGAGGETGDANVVIERRGDLPSKTEDNQVFVFRTDGKDAAGAGQGTFRIAMPKPKEVEIRSEEHTSELQSQR